MKIRTLTVALVLVLQATASWGQEEARPTDGDGGPEATAFELIEEAPDAIVPGEAFVNANAAYEAGDPAVAVELYEKLLERGYENGHLHFNLGNAYLRNGDLGRAIASYRRSQAFLPRDQDVEANLEFARRSAKDALLPPGPSEVKKTLFFWHYGLSRAELGTIVVMVNLLLWLVLVLRIYRRGSEVLRWTFMTLLLLLLVTGGSLAIRYLQPLEVAVIIPQEIDARSGTNVKDVVLFKLHAGTEVRVVDRREGSLRIALPEDGRGGWIEARHAEVVSR